MINIDSFLHSGVLMSLAPGQLVLGLGSQRWIHQPDSLQRPSFYFPDFFLSDLAPWCCCEQEQHCSIEDLINALNVVDHVQPEVIPWQQPDKEFFYTVFQDLQRRFKYRDLQKAVPYMMETANQKMTPALLRRFLSHVLHYSQCYSVQVYGFWNANEGILGATPEKLFSLKTEGKTKMVYTMACAGTASEDVHAEQFSHDPKEKKEHDLVVSAIVEALCPYGSPQTSAQQILRLPGLSHLLTPIQMELVKDLDVSTLIRAMHPTPALGAYPKKGGREWLLSYQGMIPRGRFGAPVGIAIGENIDCYVAIRNIQWNEEKLFMGAGCGVLPESQCEKEWREIERKLCAIKKLFSFRDKGCKSLG